MKKLMENPIENLIETNQNICAICGRNISGRTSRDHAFPRAIYKWSKEYLTSEEYLDLKGRIESPNNIVLTHPDCNYKKEDDLPDVEALHLSQIKYSGLISVEKGISEAVASFTNHKQELLSGQSGCCTCCGRALQTGVLRRRNPRLPRRWENACIVCHRCNLENEQF